MKTASDRPPFLYVGRDTHDRRLFRAVAFTFGASSVETPSGLDGLAFLGKTSFAAVVVADDLEDVSPGEFAAVAHRLDPDVSVLLAARPFDHDELRAALAAAVPSAPFNATFPAEEDSDACHHA